MERHVWWTNAGRRMWKRWSQQRRGNATSRWLWQTMVQQEPGITARFSQYYIQLQALPRRTRRALQGRLAQSLASVAMLLALGQAPAWALNIAVTGGCTLVDAITAANTDTPVGGCTTGGGADTLVLSGNHTLTTVNNTTYGPTGLPVVISTITIEGNNSTITRSSGDAFRIFAVNSLGNLALQDTTVSGGMTTAVGDGGGVLNRGILTLTNSTISGNSAGYNGGGVSNRVGTLTLTDSAISGNTAGDSGGGVYNGGTIILTNSTISDNRAVSRRGGGVFNYGTGTVSLTNSTISDNTAFLNGGGVDNAGDATNASVVTLLNSTISGNSTASNGGGVWSAGPVTLTNSTISNNTADGDGGGMFNDSDIFTITNSTISGNTAGDDGGGMFNDYATLTLRSTTITGNSAGGDGGGIWDEGGGVTLSRTLIAGNTATGTGDEVTIFDPITADNFNLFGHSGVSQTDAFQNFLPGATDINATTGCTTTICTPTVLSAILDPLALNTPGATQTHALVVDSPAIDASPNDGGCEATDQRGVVRPQGSACDIGAFEVEEAVGPCATAVPTQGCRVNGKLNQPCVGTPGRDTIIGTAGDDVILSLADNDVLRGNGGDDLLCGGEGNDRLIGGAGNDDLFGQEDNDILLGNAGDNFLDGGSGNDDLSGLSGADTLLGGAGTDELTGGGGTDSLEGGPGADTVDGGGNVDTCTTDAEDTVLRCELP